MVDDFADLLKRSFALSAKERMKFATAVVRGVHGQRTPLHEVLNSSGVQSWPRVGGYNHSCHRTNEERNQIHSKLGPLRSSTEAWVVAMSSPGLRRLSGNVGHPIHMISVIDKPDAWWLDYLAKAHFWRGSGPWVSDVEKTADQ